MGSLTLGNRSELFQYYFKAENSECLLQPARVVSDHMQCLGTQIGGGVEETTFRL